MKVVDLIYIILLIGTVISIYRSKGKFYDWLFESTGFLGYLVKAIILLFLTIYNIRYIFLYSEDIGAFLNTQLF